MSAFEAVVEQIRWQDIADVLVLTLVLYRLTVWLRGTVAIQVLAGMLVLAAATFAADELGLLLTTYLLRAVGAVATLVVVVVFRNEIRRALSQVNPIRVWRSRQARGARAPATAADSLARAAFDLARRRIGALVVLRRADPLEEHLTGGVVLDAQPSAELVEAIFQKTSPIHDGAAVIEGGRVSRAGCFLPLSTSASLPDAFGTRHRAAAGLSEMCDATVLVVSEERGRVCLFRNGAVEPVDSEAGLAASLAGASAGGSREGAPRGLRARARARLFDAAALAGIFLLVLGAWYEVVGERGTVVNHTVSVELRDVPLDLAADPPTPDRVAVHLRGPRPRLDGIRGGEVQAWVDLSDARPGRRRLPLRASAPTGVEVSEIVPSTVIVRVRPRR